MPTSCLPVRVLFRPAYAPCLPTKTDKLPSGGPWLHEIKHDGVRIIARKDGERVRLYSRPGNDFTRRFPLGRFKMKLPLRQDKSRKGG